MSDLSKRKFKMAYAVAYHGDPENAEDLGLSRVGFSPDLRTTNEIFMMAYRILLGDNSKTKRAEAMFEVLEHWISIQGIPLPTRKLVRIKTETEERFEDAV